ncbi:MAG: hypothetical protein MHM6MM_003693 [Cercozoa sp. M6MM]
MAATMPTHARTPSRGRLAVYVPPTEDQLVAAQVDRPWVVWRDGTARHRLCHALWEIGEEADRHCAEALAESKELQEAHILKIGRNGKARARRFTCGSDRRLRWRSARFSGKGKKGITSVSIDAVCGILVGWPAHDDLRLQEAATNGVSSNLGRVKKEKLGGGLVYLSLLCHTNELVREETPSPDDLTIDTTWTSDVSSTSFATNLPPSTEFYSLDLAFDSTREGLAARDAVLAAAFAATNKRLSPQLKLRKRVEIDAEIEARVAEAEQQRKRKQKTNKMVQQWEQFHEQASKTSQTSSQRLAARVSKMDDAKREALLNLVLGLEQRQQKDEHLDRLRSGASTPESPQRPRGRDPAEDAKKREMRRCQAADEIVQSEQVYLNFLEVCVDVFLTPLRALAVNGKIGVSPTDVTVIFGTFESLISVHRELSAEIEKARADFAFATVFLKYSRILKMYAPYVNRYDAAVERLAELQERKPKFRQWLDDVKESGDSCGLDLASFLVMPVQRVPRYVLLLRELDRYTAEGTPEAAELGQALEAMRDVAAHVNTSKGKSESDARLLELRDFVADLAPEVQWVIPTRRVLGEIEVPRLPKQRPTTLVLCNDLLLVFTSASKRLRLKNAVQLVGLRVASRDDKKGACLALSSDDTMCLMKQRLPLDALLLFDSPMRRDEWMRKLEEAKADDMRMLTSRGARLRSSSAARRHH